MIESLKKGNKEISVVSFEDKPGELELKIGFSYVSIENAKENLKKEICDLLFHTLVLAANKDVSLQDLEAELSRRHNDLNVLCLSGDILGERLVDRLIEIWLRTEFEGGRHARRVEKIAGLERCNGKPD